MSTFPLNFSDASKQPELWATQITTRLLAFAAVILRVAARRASRTPLGWDDYLIVGVTVLILLPEFGGEMAIIALGAGRHLGWILENRPEDLPVFFKLAYWTELIYAPCTTPIKCSILCLYLRLFGVRRWFRRTCYVLIGLSTVWCLVTFFLFVFQCPETADAWAPVPRTTCMAFSTLSLATNVPSVAIHVAILLLPLYPIWSLQLSPARKLLLSAVFTVGTAEVAISIARTIILHTLTFGDASWDVATAIVWSALELNIGVICCCLPVLGPLLLRTVREKRSSALSTTTQASYTSIAARLGSQGHHDPSEHVRRSYGPEDRIYQTTHIHIANHDADNARLIPLEPEVPKAAHTRYVHFSR